MSAGLTRSAGSESRAVAARGLGMRTRNKPGQPGDEGGGADRRHEKRRDAVAQRLRRAGATTGDAGMRDGNLQLGCRGAVVQLWAQI